MTLRTYRPILACLLLLLVFIEAVAQERPVVSVPLDGTEAFGHILHSFGLKPVAGMAGAQRAPDQTLIIVFGDLRNLDNQGANAFTRQSLEQFRQRGGAVLLATDYPDEGRLPPTLSCQGQPVHATGPSIYRLNGPDACDQCPVVKRWTDPAHPLFKGLRKGLATNRPSYLKGYAPELKRLAEFADDCAWADNEPHSLPAGAGYVFGSSRNAASDGRTVVLAGQGVFLNGMLMQTDNDNFAFAWNTLDWLAEGPAGRRTQALFIDSKWDTARAIGNFALPLTRLGPVPVPPIQVVNHMIRGLEEENVFNRLLVENIGKTPYLRGLLLVASLAALVWGAWRLMHARFHLDTRAALIVAKHAAAPPALPVLWQRREELRRLGNLWEPAHVLARQFFLDHAGITVPLWDDEVAAPPPVAFSGGFWQRRRLECHMHRLWDLACSSPARPVSARQFDDFLRLLAEMSAALAENKVVFATPR